MNEHPEKYALVLSFQALVFMGCGKRPIGGLNKLIYEILKGWANNLNIQLNLNQLKPNQTKIYPNDLVWFGFKPSQTENQNVYIIRLTK